WAGKCFRQGINAVEYILFYCRRDNSVDQSDCGHGNPHLIFEIWGESFALWDVMECVTRLQLSKSIRLLDHLDGPGAGDTESVEFRSVRTRRQRESGFT